MKDLGKKAQGLPEAAAKPVPDPGAVRFFRVDAESAGQRLDNYLFKLAKGVPKSHVYRIIRGGEVRINRKRVDATYRLAAGDELRLPPLRVAERADRTPARPATFPVLFEDEHLIVIDKSAGVAVHGGSGVSFGVVEQLRAHGLIERPHGSFLELVHRLDRETSGVLMLAKKRSVLTALHETFRNGAIDKRYLALVVGDWTNARQHVRAPLEKYLINDGERRVRVAADGMPAHTVFALRERFGDCTLLEVELKTGRTHQIRVHLAHLGFPIVGDPKYGDGTPVQAAQALLRGLGFTRMFLHAWRLSLQHPVTGAPLVCEAPLPADCQALLATLRTGSRA